jgi:tRNA modification GTPase
VSGGQPARGGGTCALVTSAGPAAIAVVRLTGAGVATFVDRHLAAHGGGALAVERLTAGMLRRATLLSDARDALDDVLVAVERGAPDWDVRIHLHGNPWLARACLRLAEDRGLTATEAGALWSGADAEEAAAWKLLPRMLTLRGAEWVLEQVERRRLARDTLAGAAGQVDPRIDWFVRPVRVALVGPPNVGKSTLANALADRAVSLVSATPGTTRDWVEVAGEVEGFPVVWVDTAGLRDTRDELEAAGLARTQAQMAAADAVLVVLDATPAAQPERAAFAERYKHLRPACVALNKSDLVEPAASAAAIRELPAAWQPGAVALSAAQPAGLEALTRRLLVALGRAEIDWQAPCAFSAHAADA